MKGIRGSLPARLSQPVDPGGVGGFSHGFRTVLSIPWIIVMMLSPKFSYGFIPYPHVIMLCPKFSLKASGDNISLQTFNFTRP